MILHIKKNANKKALTLAKCLNLFNIIPSIIKIGARISIVSKKNYGTLPLWRDTYPECKDGNNPKYDFCMDMMRNILGEVGDEQIRLDNKVIKKLSQHILVDKN